MTRRSSPDGIPGDDVVAYYGRRAANDVGLIISEGTWVPHTTASNDDRIPRFYGDAIPAWEKVLNAVHASGGKIVPQLWHVGLYRRDRLPDIRDGGDELDRLQKGPSGVVGFPGGHEHTAENEMALSDISEVVEAFGAAAETAWRTGFDGVALHGGHGYLLDQFLWDKTNLRKDGYGGSPRNRAKFVADIVSECRRRTYADFPIILRVSQWKLQDYGARIANDPAELAALLEPIVLAGCDIIDCSQRRFWEPAFAGSDLNLAGWVKKITGLPTMTVGSVGLSEELFATMDGHVASVVGLEELYVRLDRGEFDLVGVGRALLGDPEWVSKMRDGRTSELKPYTKEALKTLW